MLKAENYCITPENVIVHELIGLNASVQSSDYNKSGLQGKIVDETKNTIILENKNGEKIIPKKEARFEVELGKEKATIEGKDILYKPEQRTKILWGKRK